MYENVMEWVPYIYAYIRDTCMHAWTYSNVTWCMYHNVLEWVSYIRICTHACIEVSHDARIGESWNESHTCMHAYIQVWIMVIKEALCVVYLYVYYIYIYIYIYIHTHTHTNKQTHTHTYTYTERVWGRQADCCNQGSVHSISRYNMAW